MYFTKQKRICYFLNFKAKFFTTPRLTKHKTAYHYILNFVHSDSTGLQKRYLVQLVIADLPRCVRIQSPSPKGFRAHSKLSNYRFTQCKQSPNDLYHHLFYNITLLFHTWMILDYVSQCFQRHLHVFQLLTACIYNSLAVH